MSETDELVERLRQRLVYGLKTDADTYIDPLCEEAAAELTRLQAERERLAVALDRIATYGETYVGYVNATIDGLPISKFARSVLDAEAKEPTP